MQIPFDSSTFGFSGVERPVSADHEIFNLAFQRPPSWPEQSSSQLSLHLGNRSDGTGHYRQQQQTYRNRNPRFARSISITKRARWPAFRRSTIASSHVSNRRITAVVSWG